MISSKQLVDIYLTDSNHLITASNQGPSSSALIIRHENQQSIVIKDLFKLIQNLRQ